jgi:hypothetical protein
MKQFQDHTGSTSNGRVISFIVICISLLVLVSGSILAYFESLEKTGTGYGIIIIGSMVGLITTVLGYLMYHKTQETKTEIETIKEGVK